MEVFPGNTQDVTTFSSQVEKVANRFGCERATLVGDRGMIKSALIAGLPEGFSFITAITKPQIESLLDRKVIQLAVIPGVSSTSLNDSSYLFVGSYK